MGLSAFSTVILQPQKLLRAAHLAPAIVNPLQHRPRRGGGTADAAAAAGNSKQPQQAADQAAAAAAEAPKQQLLRPRALPRHLVSFGARAEVAVLEQLFGLDIFASFGRYEAH